VPRILGIHLLLAWLLTINGAAFLLFGWDKWRARSSGRRVPETRLLLCALLGGFLGSWGGSWSFHHKTRKEAFRSRHRLATLGALTIWIPLCWWLLERGGT